MRWDDGIYDELFWAMVPRTALKEEILDWIMPKNHDFLDEEAYNHPLEEEARLYGDPYVTRCGQSDVISHGLANALRSLVSVRNHLNRILPGKTKPAPVA